MCERERGGSFSGEPKAALKAKCGLILIDKKNTEELIGMLGLKESMDKLAKANGVSWYSTVCVIL